MSIKIKFFNVLNNRYEIDVGHQEPIFPKAQRSKSRPAFVLRTLPWVES